MKTQVKLEKANSGNSRTIDYILGELDSMTIGFTKVINGMVVTKWGKWTFEVGTWGKSTLDRGQTLAALMS